MSQAGDGTTGEIQQGTVIEVNGFGNEDSSLHFQIHRAAVEGDWEAARDIYRRYNLDFNDPTTDHGQTLLHVAATTGHVGFVTELVQVMSDAGLTRRDDTGRSAIILVAMGGEKAVAKAIIDKKRNLVMTRDAEDLLPVHFAGMCAHKEMVSYLYEVCRDELGDNDLAELCSTLIENHVHDIALEILENRWERLATSTNRHGTTILQSVAHNPHFLGNTTVQVPSFEALNTCSIPFYHFGCKKNQHHIARELVKSICRRVGSLSTNRIEELIGRNWAPLFRAAKQGNVEFLRIFIRTFPSILLMSDNNGQSIFHIAVVHRHEEIFRWIHEIGPEKTSAVWTKDNNGDTMLHHAGKLAPLTQLNAVPGAALQLQRELLWFQEVTKAVGHVADFTNLAGKTGEDVFMENHEALIKKGEEWMRNTANSCLIVATLVATVVFAAAFTAPGGNDQNTGLPVFLNRTMFKIFIMSDAISLVFAVTSVLTFLSVLTSTYQLEDFVRSLPMKLLVGLTTLFVSIVAMMVAFVSVFFVYFKQHHLLGYALPVAVAAFVPISLFIVFHFRLFVNVIKSTYTFTWNVPFRPDHRDPLFPAPKNRRRV